MERFQIFSFSKYLKIEHQGFLNFIEDPAIDYMDWSNSFGDSNKSGFWIGAKVKNIPDITHLLDNDPLIDSDELSPTTMTVSELEHHKKFNYGSGYDRHEPTQELTKIADALGFENPSSFLAKSTNIIRLYFLPLIRRDAPKMQ